MSRVPDFEGVDSLSDALLSASAANEDSVLFKSTKTIAIGWDAYDVWRRTIKEPRERRWHGENVTGDA